MKIKLILILIFVPSVVFSQVKREMLSSQASTEINNDIIVTQTVGQQSTAIGSNPGTLIIQGFQQPNWSELIDDSANFSITSYPNPFVTNVTFSFTKEFNETDHSNEIFNINIYDISGREVFRSAGSVIEQKLIFDLSSLPVGPYLVRLHNEFKTYYKKLIKTFQR